MNVDDIEELIRRYLSTGIAVVIILVAPGTGDGGVQAGALPADPRVVVVEPDRPPAAAPELGTGAGDGSPAAREPADPTGPGRTHDRGTEPAAPDGTARDPGSAGAAAGAPAPDHAPSGDAASGDAAAEDGTADDRTGADGTDPEHDSRPDSGGTTYPRDRDTGTGTGTGTGDDGDRGDTTDARTEDVEEGDRGGPATRGTLDTPADPGSDAAAGTGTAADRHGWGSPEQMDDFSGGVEQWSIYEGPGHAGKGTRSASAVSVEDGILTITGDSAGTTAGMAWNPGQKYGRWEARVKAPASDPSYNALLLLWPDAEDFPVGGEIDFMEMQDPSRQETDLFIHHGPDNEQVNGQVQVDGTEWHNWAVEWTPESITAYVDGQEWYRTTDSDIFPPDPMHLCIQLDWFPKGDAASQESAMHVDWVKQYALTESATGSVLDPASSTGPGDSDSDEENGSAEQEPVREIVRRMFSWR